MNTFTIKDLENLSGIKAHTIRIWEQRYSFLKPERTGTNIRYYSNSELKTVLNIALLNKYGYKISHIDKMSEAEIKDKLLALNQLQAQQERIVNDLIQHMIDMDMDEFERIINNYIAARGIERSITQIIFPFLEKIGILWLTSHINPAQEHLVSNVVRQKLIVGIEGVSTSLKVDKTVLLFLPEGEYHEMGLLFMNYILKSRGVSTVYIGANIPLEDLEYVVRYKKPDYLYCHLTTVGQGFNFDRFMSNVTKRFSTIPLIVSGQLTHTWEKKIPPSVNFKKTLHEVMEFVASL
jgi:MerR family transcriptional regulator, light-induced transcriptional regulator